MRLRRYKEMPAVEADMTPMIDMTFQLIAFFMVLINFTEAEQNERITLPLSALATPPDAPPESPLTIQLTKDGTVLFAGEEVPVGGIEPYLLREVQLLESLNRSPTEATVIIRADATVRTGVVQEVIKACQEKRFEKFSLRAKQEEADT